MAEQFTELRLSMRRTLCQGDRFKVVGVRGKVFVFEYATVNTDGQIIVSAKDPRKKTFRAFYADKVRPEPKARRRG